MKKIYFSVFTICATLSLNAQQTIGFENVILTPESYNNGSTGSGGFIENGVVFNNQYNISQWGNYATGFSVSNMTDVTTSGSVNQYSAFTGGGAASSSNYGICNGSGIISFAGQGVDLKSIQITNTTYAAISMRDGDAPGQFAFAKKFGSLNNAQGNPDGTNGEDFFKVWVFAHAEDSSKIDSVEFFLADYRFSNDVDDYIVDTWETIDLSFINETVYSLSFKLYSSDVMGVYLNTPAYFAVDNLVIDKNIGLIEANLADVLVYPNPMNDELFVKGESGVIEIFDVAGKIVLSTNHLGYSVLDVSNFSAGSYTMKLTNERGSFVQKIIK
jgi:hypothetical protein